MTFNMRFLVICLLLPMIDTIVIVQIHQSATYHPVSTCAFLRNVSMITDPSIQSCIWECVHDNNCQTAGYFDDEKVCSIFAESCRSDGIQPSGTIQASVICYRTNQELSITCSSTVTPDQVEEKETTVSLPTTDTVQTPEIFQIVLATTFLVTTTTVIRAMTTQNNPSISVDDSSIASNQWIQYNYSYLATTSASLTLQFKFQASTHYHWYLDDVSVQSSASTEMLMNGNFESTSSLTGWTKHCISLPLLGLYCGLSTHGCHSSNQCYYDCCITGSSIWQSFNAINGQLYNIKFWIYLDHVSSSWPNLITPKMSMIIS